jgi:hypothetical protein
VVGVSANGSRALLERRLPLILAVVFLLGISLVAEFRSYARADIGFLLDAATRVLDGARLYVDVVEINPPLIVALNAAVVWLARLLHFDEILLYRIAITAVLLGSLWLSSTLLRSVVSLDVRTRRLLLLALAFVLFPLAESDFGEREHLVVALLVPYVLVAAARLAGHPVPKARAFLVGLLAGSAFALKPQFLLLWPLIEVLLRTRGRIPTRALLPESVAVAAFVTGYLVLIAVVTPEYFDLVRLLAVPYSRFLYDPFYRLLVTGPGAVLTLFALLAFTALRPNARHPALWTMLALAAAACLIAGAVQQKGLRYHFYPAFSLATLILALVPTDSFAPADNRVRTVYRAIVAGVLAATVAMVCVRRTVAALGHADDPGRDQLEQLVGLVRTHAEGAGVFVMSYHIESAYPLVNYSGVRSASRFPHLWILAAEYLDALKSPEPLRYRDRAEMSPSERYLHRAVSEDLGRRPRLLLVFRNARDLPANGYRRLDYIAYFSRDSAVASILREYQLVASTGDYLVYQWVPPGAPRVGPLPAAMPGAQDIVQVADIARRSLAIDPALLAGLAAFVGGIVAAWLTGRNYAASPTPEGPPPPHLAGGPPVE